MIIRTIVLFIIVSLCSLFAAANTLYVKDFGVVGDSSTNGGQAIRKAVKAEYSGLTTILGFYG